METDFSKKDIAGVLFQYPDTDGSVDDYSRVVEEAKKFGVNPIISSNWGRKNWTQLGWPVLAKFRHFSIIVKPFGNFWLLIKYLAKTLLTYFSKFCMLLGKYWTNDLAIFSHWNTMRFRQLQFNVKYLKQHSRQVVGDGWATKYVQKRGIFWFESWTFSHHQMLIRLWPSVQRTWWPWPCSSRPGSLVST